MVKLGKYARRDATIMEREFNDSVPQAKVDALLEFGRSVEGQFAGQLIVDREYVDMEHHGAFHYYYLAEEVKGKIFWVIPATFHRILVSMDDRTSRSNSGCTVLDPLLKDVAMAMNEKFATLSGKPSKIIEDKRPLVIRHPLLEVQG